MSEHQRMQAKMSNNQARQHGDVLAQLLDETNAKYILIPIRKRDSYKIIDKRRLYRDNNIRK